MVLCALLIVPSHAQEQEPQHLVVLGDSIAAGHGVMLEQSYAWLLARSKGLDLNNLAFDGNSSMFLRWDIVLDTYLREAVADADVIIVSIGGNDFLLAEGLDGFRPLVVRAMLGDHSFMQPIWEAFEERFAVIIAEIRTLNPNAMLIVQTVYNSAIQLPTLRRTFATGVGGINTIIYDYLEQYLDAFYIADIYSAFDNRSGLIARDMIHPSGMGHAIIAHVLSDVISGTETPLPYSNTIVDVLAFISSLILWLIDFVLFRIGVWLLFLLGLLSKVHLRKRS